MRFQGFWRLDREQKPLLREFRLLNSYRRSTSNWFPRRRQSFRLRTGHKHAVLYTESAEYHYLKKLDAAKAWFRGNIDQVLSIYGREHNVQKEDVFLGKPNNSHIKPGRSTPIF